MSGDDFVNQVPRASPRRPAHSKRHACAQSEMDSAVLEQGGLLSHILRGGAGIGKYQGMSFISACRRFAVKQACRGIWHFWNRLGRIVQEASGALSWLRLLDAQNPSASKRSAAGASVQQDHPTGISRANLKVPSAFLDVVRARKQCSSVGFLRWLAMLN